MQTQSSPSGAIELELDDYPRVVMTFRGAVATGDVPWLIDQLEALLTLPTPYALLVQDVDGVRGIGAHERRALVSWSKEREARIAEKNLCAAIVLRSRIARGVFTAFRWLMPPCECQLSICSKSSRIYWGLACFISRTIWPQPTI